eukprot:16194-Prymnesium_polylepis.3
MSSAKKVAMASGSHSASVLTLSLATRSESTRHECTGEAECLRMHSARPGPRKDWPESCGHRFLDPGEQPLVCELECEGREVPVQQAAAQPVD